MLVKGAPEKNMAVTHQYIDQGGGVDIIFNKEIHNFVNCNLYFVTILHYQNFYLDFSTDTF